MSPIFTNMLLKTSSVQISLVATDMNLLPNL